VSAAGYGHVGADLLARARRVLPGVTQTYSKGPDQHVEGVYPVYLERGLGCRVWDVDGREYIDYPCALGPVILGYGHAAVDSAVHRQVDRGPSFSLGHPLEVAVAELLVEMVPGAEKVRFVKTGSEATSAAVRIARAFTGRDHVAQCGYHGWHDWCIGHTSRNAGVPPAVRAMTHQWSYNDLESLHQVLQAYKGEMACVIMEPVGIEDPQPGFLAAVRELTHAFGALLIFDEVITGFRLAPGGAQQHYGVAPDLASFGKAMANGYAVAAVTGRGDVMEVVSTTAFVSGTFAGEAVALAAAEATLETIRDQPVCEHLWRQGRRLQQGFNALAAEYEVPARMTGLPPRRVLATEGVDGFGPSALKGLIWQNCLDRGVLLSNANFVSFAHDDDAVGETLTVFDRALADVRRALMTGDPIGNLRGPAPGEVFRRA
jgi:glutamate-1-semialdehyde-2,1-aminomutase